MTHSPFIASLNIGLVVLFTLVSSKNFPSFLLILQAGFLVQQEIERRQNTGLLCVCVSVLKRGVWRGERRSTERA